MALSPSSFNPNWLNLPSELTSLILCRLNRKEILESVQWVCVTWHEAFKEPFMWRSIDMYDLLDTPTYETEAMCRDAVDRSSGRLEEITLRSFCSGRLIRYVADRAPQLKILRLSCCYNLYQEDLREVPEKLQNLEELHIFSTTISKEVIESFGHYCTQLRSLIYNYMDDEDDKAAVAIAQTMPGLRHLSLCKNKLTNNDLLAILKKCPHLESLDLSNCPNVNLKGDFGKTCAERIKNLKLPHGPIDGCKKTPFQSNEFGYDSSNNEIYTSDSSDDEIYTSSSSSVSSQEMFMQNWLVLPAKATKSILHRLGAIEILEIAQKVCLTWRVVCKHPSMWRSIDMKNSGELEDMYDLNVMCRHAVDRSYGRLDHIILEYFADVKLLDHIAERAPQLRSLQLGMCSDIYKDEMCEVAKKLPNLEELNMFCSEVPKEALESFGQYCPQLIFLTYNIKDCRVSDMVDDYNMDQEALAIAGTMPGLRHLNLQWNPMTNNGLNVILNQCPHLESLDLRRCYNVNLEGALGMTCAQRIKNLKHPNDLADSINDDDGNYFGY